MLENIGYDNKSSLLIVKRLITRLYQHNYLMISANDSNQNQFFWVQQEFAFSNYIRKVVVIVEISFSLQLISSFEGTEIVISYKL